MPYEQERFDFWKMIVQNNVTKIINLTESDNSYIPVEGEPQMKFKTPQGEFFIKLENEITGSQFDRRQLKVIHTYKGEADGPLTVNHHKVEHIHFTEWPDCSVPETQISSDTVLKIAVNDCVGFLEDQYKRMV